MEKSKVLSTVIISFCIGMVLYGLWDRHKLNSDFQCTTGTITGCRFLPKSGGRIGISYEYNVGLDHYANSSNYIEILLQDCEDHFIGKKFPVAYNPGKKELSTLLIVPDNFKRFGYDFPDSLKWVLQYIKR